MFRPVRRRSEFADYRQNLFFMGQGLKFRFLFRIIKMSLLKEIVKNAKGYYRRRFAQNGAKRREAA